MWRDPSVGSQQLHPLDYLYVSYSSYLLARDALTHTGSKDARCLLHQQTYRWDRS